MKRSRLLLNNAGETATPQGTVGVADKGIGTVALTAPFPNPTKNSTACSAVLPLESRVRVRVLDLQGRTVRTLVDGLLPVGRHGFIWDGDSDGGQRAASGLYLLELETKGVRQTRRLAVVR